MEPLFYKVSLRCGKNVIGIVDHVSHRYIHMFDVTEEDNALLICLAIEWQLNAPGTRFSHYLMQTFPGIKLPPARLIPRFAVTHSNKEIPLPYAAVRPKRKKLKVD